MRTKGATNNVDDIDDGDDDGDVNSLGKNHHPYVCVYCGTPCAVLYRQLTSSLSSIKAMRCENDRCQRIVDPYIEREWLLIVIDCILLRPEAYRHVLYNNRELSWPHKIFYGRRHETKNDDAKEKTNDNDNDIDIGTVGRVASVTSILQRLVQWTVLSSLFHAYLKWQTLADELGAPSTRANFGLDDDSDSNIDIDNDIDNDDDSSAALLFGIFVVASILDLLVQWLAIYGCTTLLSTVSSSPPPSSVSSEDSKNNKSTAAKKQPEVEATPTTSSTANTTGYPHSLAHQIYLALLLPTAFQVATVVVLIWENSKTTRALGSLLVACWQSLGVAILSIHRFRSDNSESSSSNKSNKNESPDRTIASLAPVLAGAVSLMAWRYTVGRLLPVVSTATNPFVRPDRWMHRIPCVGFEMDAAILVAAESVGGVAGGRPPPVPICLT